MSSYFGTYVDDIRPAAETEDHCHKVAKKNVVIGLKNVVKFHKGLEFGQGY